jgi:hypothetical protein
MVAFVLNAHCVIVKDLKYHVQNAPHGGRRLNTSEKIFEKRYLNGYL